MLKNIKIVNCLFFYTSEFDFVEFLILPSAMQKDKRQHMKDEEEY